VAKRASFSAAAREVGRSQAAISLSIARMEQQFGHRLFERTPRGVTQTAAGETLLAYARRILETEEEAFAALCGAPAQQVRLGLPDDYMDGIGTLALARFAALWPDVPVEICCDFSRRLEVLIDRGELDLAVISRHASRSRGEKLRDEPQLWCAARDTAPERQRVLPLALFTAECRARPLVIEALGACGRPWRLAYTCSHLHGIYAAVERGGALAVLPAACVPAQFRVLGPESGLPPLPPIELALLMRDGSGVMARRLGEVLSECFAAKDAGEGGGVGAGLGLPLGTVGPGGCAGG
jgi:DNA-binding transcriptional LysR family regulator